MRLRLDPATRVIDDATIVVGGSPLSLFRLGAAGARVARALVAGDPLPRGHEPLTDRLIDAGVVHPEPDPESDACPTSAEVTVVVPVRDVDASTLQGMVSRLRGAGVARVIVVDDESRTPVPSLVGADVVRLDRNLGPGGARNAGAAVATTAFVAFVDADVDAPGTWLTPLLGHFADPRVALVAPRVRGAGGNSWLAQFETWRSPLDLGPAPARIRAGSRVSYVPAAALVVRTAAFREIGGFDPSLRFGEDVDLVWRLDEAGHRCRYEPTSEVRHATRPDLRRWMRQRFEYGTSAAPLALRHPGALAPVRISGWSALAWGVVALVSVPVGIAIGAGTTAALAPKLRPMQRPAAEAARLGGLGNLFAGRVLAAGVTRAWWPLSFAAALVSRRARRVVALCFVVPAVVDWAKDRPAIDPFRALILRTLDDLAYGSGVWAGALRHRTAAPLRPDLTNWPPRPRQGRSTALRTASPGVG